MNRSIIRMAGVAGMAAILSCSPQKTEDVTLISPDGLIGVQVHHNPQDASISFSASLDGKQVLNSSPLGIRLEGQGLDFSHSLVFKAYREHNIDMSYEMSTGKQVRRRNLCTEGIFTFENEDGGSFEVVFRLFNDGLAYRYKVENDKVSSVEVESSGFSFEALRNVWSIPFSSGDERIFKAYEGSNDLQEQPLSFPVLVETEGASWFLVTEADVSDYPLSSGSFTKDRLDFVFAREKEAVNEAGPGFVSPWRVLMMGKELSAIVENCMVDHLAPPAVEGIPEWVEAGVTSFPWWGENTANSHPEILKSYIDLSAAMGWRYIEFDVALINSPARAVEDWKTTSWIKDIVDYAGDRGVLCYGWDEYSNLNTAEKRADIFGKYAAFGIAGCKVDFVNSYSQNTRKVVEEIIRDAAEYQLMLSFHGAQSPRGFARTYPHVMSFEAAKGAEYYLEINGGKGVPPSHNCILPYTRNVLGSMDYTPVAFTSEIRTTTMAHELALSVIFESGWQGMCDIPEAYLESPGKAFLHKLPAAWDETRFLAGYPGEYCCMARRKGEVWYVAGISSGGDRSVGLDLSGMLQNDAGILFYDDEPGEIDAIRVTEKEISPSSPFEIEIKKNGGFAFIIYPEIN